MKDHKPPINGGRRGGALTIMAAIYSDLKDKTVIVTGGAGGIGEGIVRAFHAQGARVGFLDIDVERGRRLQAELGQTALFVACDLTDIPALKAAVIEIRAAFGPIDILVNNAAHDEDRKSVV